MVEESHGIQGNLGISGTDQSAIQVLKALCNVQENRFFQGQELHVYGLLSELINHEDELAARQATTSWDKALTQRLIPIFSAGKTPILIGGGHNNALPLLEAYFTACQQACSAINIDPHADFRALEGRHSGNGFSYAMDQGFLNRYFVFGLHESYNSESMLKRMDQSEFVDYNSFEDIAIRGNLGLGQAMDQAMVFVQQPCGLELDIDAVVGAPASAATVQGWNPSEARKLVHSLANKSPFEYLHLPEFAAELHQGQLGAWSKWMAHLIIDFIKAQRAYGKSN